MNGMKEIRWVGASKKRLKEFPDEAMDEAGHQLRQIQMGFEPADWKPMAVVGPGVIELRVHRPAEYRVIYLAKYPEAIYILQSFYRRSIAFVPRLLRCIHAVLATAHSPRLASLLFRSFQRRPRRHPTKTLR